MLVNLFENSHRYYHIVLNKITGKRHILDDCPPDRFEKLKEHDEAFFSRTGEHLYDNFEKVGDQP